LPLSLQQPGPAATRTIVEWTAASLGLCWQAAALDRVLHANLPLRDVIAFLQQTAAANPLNGEIDWADVDALVAPRKAVCGVEPRAVLTAVARHFRLKIADLVGPSRRRSLIHARGVAICLLRDLVGLTWQSIAENTGRKDHSTVLHAYAKTRQSLASNALLGDALQQLRRKLEPSNHS
jgi:chromosomal replication initiation ATPase DnaA